jgi:hypothetical protein
MCTRQINSFNSIFLSLDSFSVIPANLFYLQLQCSYLYLSFFKRTLILNLRKPRKMSVDHLQRDHVRLRSIISQRGSVVFMHISLSSHVLWYLPHNLKVLLWIYLQRRRDRINEKMKALQELIPRSNKVNRLFKFPGFYILRI